MYFRAGFIDDFRGVGLCNGVVFLGVRTGNSKLGTLELASQCIPDEHSSNWRLTIRHCPRASSYKQLFNSLAGSDIYRFITTVSSSSGTSLASG